MTLAPRRGARRRLGILPLIPVLAGCPGEQVPSGPSGPVATLTFEQAAETLFVGASATLRATPRTTSGQTVIDRPVTYTVVGTNTSATVTPDTWTVGVDATEPGSLTIQATCDDKMATVAITVVSRPTSMTVSPTSLLLESDETATITPTIYAAATALPAAPRSFGSANAAVATVNGAGLVTAHAAGSTTITVTSDTVVRQVPVTVTAPAAPVFTINVRWVGTAPDAALIDAVAAAVARWQEVLTAELPDAVVNVAANTCFAGMPAVSETVDDILVFIQVDSVDGAGGILALGGPCIIRGTSELPIIGRVTVDRADVANMTTRGLLGDLVTHEMGHTLGIGTLWKFGSRDLLQGEGTSDPTFTGARARDASAFLGFTASAGTNVPVESTGGSGTAEGHWRESTFGAELMTGFINTGANALSRITAASLADLGYTVDESRAEAFSRTAAVVMAGEASAGVRIQERVERPRFRLGENGLVIPVGR